MTSPGAGLGGQVALVTGAARGLGRGIVLALAEQEADIVLADVRPEPDAEGVAAAVRALGRRCLVVRADVSVAAEVERLFAETDKSFGRLDILVNNAGTSRAQTIGETTEADWDALLDVNLKSAFLCSKAAFALMVPRRSGRIVNISSVAGEQGALFGHVHYSASKSGLLGLTKTLARSAAPHGITVNAVAPGVIETELSRVTHGSDGLTRLAAAIPLGLGTARDVGLAVAFLCGEGGRYISGATLDVNGGQYMR